MARLSLLLVFLAAGPAAAADYPQVPLKNDALKLTVYLPDAEKGFYRGTRFDHAGVFGNVEFAGHKLFGPWKDKHDPTNNDDILGPCEEFGMQEPLGWADAKPGETFLKIGTGELEKPADAKEYQFWHHYKVVRPAAWKETARDATSIGWETAASLPSGVGYRYAKRLALDPKEPTVTISHRLENAGTKPLTTTVYNHNFFNVDGDPVGPNYRIVFAFDPKAADPKERFAEVAKLSGNTLGFAGPLDNGSIWSVLTGFRDATARGFSIDHRPSRIRLVVSQSVPFDRLVVWGVKTCLCPEPFTTVTLAPGKAATWDVTYRFEVEEK